jgi:hypothetical protein
MGTNKYLRFKCSISLCRARMQNSERGHKFWCALEHKIHLQCWQCILCDRYVTGTWLVLLRQATVRCPSVDSVHIQCECDVSISLSAYDA